MKFVKFRRDSLRSYTISLGFYHQKSTSAGGAGRTVTPLFRNIFSKYVYRVSAVPKPKHFWGHDKPVPEKWNEMFDPCSLTVRQSSLRPVGAASVQDLHPVRLLEAGHM